MRKEINETLIIYSEEYCEICSKLKQCAEIKLEHADEITYIALCKNCLKTLLEGFKNE